jgi:CHAT domain-containing protein
VLLLLASSSSLIAADTSPFVTPTVLQQPSGIETISPALKLWRELEPLVARRDEGAARKLLAARDVAALRALYRELLFDAFTALLYENAALPHAEEARLLLAGVDAAGESAALEAKFKEWAKERRAGVGFSAAGEGFEGVLYLCVVSKFRGEGADAGTGAPAGTARELSERALQLSKAIGLELGVACFSGNMAVYGMQERRFSEVRPLLAVSEAIYERWRHLIGIAQVPLIIGQAEYLSENWKEAAPLLSRAAELSRALPAMRAQRVMSLSLLATTTRNLGDKEATRAALTAAVEEQERIVGEEATRTGGGATYTKNSRALAGFQVQLGGALGALGRHVEAGEWLVRAEALKARNYKIDKAQLENTLAGTTAKLTRDIEASRDETQRAMLKGLIRTITDTTLSALDMLATEVGDKTELMRVAERRLTLAREGGTPPDIAKGLEGVANLRRRAGNLPEARAGAEEALRLRAADPRRAQIYESYYLLASIASDADDWRTAAAHYREVIKLTRPDALPPLYDLDALPAEQREMHASMNAYERNARARRALDAHMALGFLLTQQGNYREADAEYKIVVDETAGLYAAGARDEADLRQWLSTQPNPASIKGEHLAEHRRKSGMTVNGSEERRLTIVELAVAASRAMLAMYRAMLLDAQNDLERASAAYETARVLMENLSGGLVPVTSVYVAQARLERERGNYRAAEAPIVAALAEFTRVGDASGIAAMLSFQSALRRDAGAFAEARRLAEEALKLARPLGSRTQLAGMLHTLGRAESEAGGAASLHSAEKHLREALGLRRELNARSDMTYTLMALGLTLERAGREDEALASYEEAVRLVETLAGSLSQDASAESFNASRGNSELYERLIKLLIKRGRAADALHYLERSKSKALVDALAGAQVNASDPAVKSLLERVRASGDALRVEERLLSTELAKPAGGRDEARITNAQNRLTEARRQYAEAVATLKRDHPNYASLVAVNPTNFDELRRHLPEKTVLLSYFPTEREIYIFVISRETGTAASVRTVPVTRAALAQMVNDYRRALNPVVSGVPTRGLMSRTGGSAANRGASAQGGGLSSSVKELTGKLYDALLAPVAAEIAAADTLLIVPAAELYYLPFHALGRVKDDNSIAFLIEEKRFAYLASADTLKALSSAETTKTAIGQAPQTNTLFAVGNPDGSLPGAGEEVAAISRIFAEARVFTGRDATVKSVVRSSARAPYVHFATHGMINSVEPKETYLLLAGDPNRLSIKDIVENRYQLSFDGARLVTLSACDTNVGGWDPSATYSSLSRAFFTAGAPTIVASLWSVSDESTRDTMAVFYRELAAGQPKAEALRRAQLSIMRNPRFANPFYWAPFVVLGDWR